MIGLPGQILSVLAQDGGAAGTRPLSEWTIQDSMRVGIAVGLVIIMVLVLGIVLLQVRRRMLEKDQSEISAAGSLLDELRRARARGEMTEAEYEAARRAATARAVDKGGRAESPKPAARAPVRPVAPPGSLVAKPGFDLTGAPLPRPDTEEKKE